jgi:signal transduction histidine kinase
MIAEHQETVGGGAAEEREQDRLLSALGHELRNSINSMNLAVELMERRCADPALDRPRALLKR